MELDLGRAFMPDQRRSIRVLEPVAQIRLPVILVTLTAIFVSAFAWNSHAAYERLIDLTLAQTQDAFRGTVSDQTSDFLIVSFALLGGYLVAVAGICLAYTHHLIGPRVAMIRQIAALKRGDYSARVFLRESDLVFRDMARDLNELAHILQVNDRALRRSHASGGISQRAS